MSNVQNAKVENTEYDYFSELVNDAITELIHHHETYCFNRSQLKQIQSKVDCNVTIDDDGIYILTA